MYKMVNKPTNVTITLHWPKNGHFSASRVQMDINPSVDADAIRAKNVVRFSTRFDIRKRPDYSDLKQPVYMELVLVGCGLRGVVETNVIQKEAIRGEEDNTIRQIITTARLAGPGEEGGACILFVFKRFNRCRSCAILAINSAAYEKLFHNQSSFH